MSIIRKSSSKSLIDNISARLERLEAAANLGNDAREDVEEEDPETAELRARYAKYKEEKAEKWKRLGREPTYHESWAELTFPQYLYCVKGQGTPEQRYQKMRVTSYLHKGCNPTGCIPECRYYPNKGRIEDEEAIAELERGKEKMYPSCQLSIRFHSRCDECKNNRII